MTVLSDPYQQAPGASGAVTAQGLSGALGQNQPVAPGGSAAATPQFGTGFNLPSYQTLGSLFNVVNMPQQVATDQRVNDLQNRLGLGGAIANQQRGYLTSDAARDRERLGLQRAMLGDQSAALGKTADDINYNADRQIQNFMGGQAARGATHTEGTRRGIGDFQRQRWRGMENLNLDRAQLARTAKNLGLQEEELGIRLDRALSQLGLDQALQTQDVLQAITDAEAGRFNPVSQLLGQIYALSGVRPLAGAEGPTNYPTSPAPGGSGGGTKRVM